MDETRRLGTRSRHRGVDRRVLVTASETNRDQEYTVDRHVRPVVPDRGRSQFRGHRRGHQVSLHEKVILFLLLFANP